MKTKIFMIFAAVLCLCALCAVAVSAEGAPETDIVAHNLSLNDSVNIIYYADFQNVPENAEKGILIWTSARDEYIYGSENAKLTTIRGISAGYPTYAFTGVSAKMMSQDIYAKSYIKVGDEITYGPLDKYSVLQYCYNKKGSTTTVNGGTKTLGELVEKMLEYGAWAQEYFNYNTDRLANAEYFEINGELCLCDHSSVVIDEAVAATCTAYGLTEGSHCANCGKVLIAQETVVAFGHSYGFLISEVPATCTQSGVRAHYTCSVCGKNFSNTTNANAVTDDEMSISPLGHNFEASYTTNEAEHWYKCLRCGELSDREAHTFDNGVVTTLSTETTIGVMTYTCTTCGYIKTSLLPVASKGLKYESNGDGTCYVSGIGACTDVDIAIPAVSPDGDSVTGIVESAFFNCWKIESIEFPESIIVIGAFAFDGCDHLTSVTIPDGIKTIEDGAFNNCFHLEDIVIPNSVTSMGNGVFSGCYSLTSITIPFVGAKADVTASSTYQYPFGYIFGTSSYTGGTATTQYYYGSSTSSTINTTYYIPSSLKSVTVTGGYIPYGAFYNCSGLTNITIGEGITSIGNYAFSYCSSLTSVNITDIVKWCAISFGNYSANPLYYAHNLYLNGELVTELVIPEGVTNIGIFAFEGCSSLTSIKIPASVTIIGSSAFNGCSSLESITIPFVGAKSGVTASSTYQYPFGYIFGEISYTGGTATKQYYYGSRTSSTTYSTYYIPSSLKSVTVTGGYIPYGAFYNCSGLTSITIGEGVTSIGDSAFYGCSSLESITIPFVGNKAGITSSSTYQYPFGYIFGTYSYTGGTATTQNYYGSSTSSTTSSTYYIPSSLKSVTVTGGYIPYGAFYNCSGLTNITIGEGVTRIGNDAFFGCGSLTSVNITDIAKWYEISFSSYYANPLYYAHNLYLNGELVTELVIPEDVKSIGYSAFSGCSSLTSIEIPSSVTSIGNSAFNGCSSLTSIEIPASVTSIGSYAFSGCSSLTSITVAEGNTVYHSAGNCIIETASKTLIAGCKNSIIPNGVTSIGYSAFYKCSALMSIEIPASVTSIEEKAFCGCSSLTSIEIPASVTSIGNQAFSGCSSLTSIEIPASVTSIGNYAFYGCSSLTSIEIPASVTSIGQYAFQESALTSITFAENSQLTSIGSSAFYGCSFLTSIEIPASVTSIGNYAFSGCSSLTSIEIPSSVTSIGNYAFSGCSSLTSIEIPSSVTSIRSSAFYNCSSLTSVNITDIAKWCKISFGDSSANPLYYAHNLYLNGELVTELVIPEGVTSIGNYAFSGCSSLTSIEIPSSVTSLGSSAFSGCSKLTSISIPASVTSIGSGAFSGCPIKNASMPTNAISYIPKAKLKSVIITGGTSIGSGAFSGCSSLESITIPFVGNKAGITSSSTYQYPFGYIFGTSSYTGGTATTQDYYGSNTYYTTSSTYYIPSSLKSVTVTGGYIPYGAFYNCSGLTSITIGDAVTSIAWTAFYGCSIENASMPTNAISYITQETKAKLKSVVITGGTSIRSSAFYDCSSLTSIEIPASVTSIGNSAFSGCSSLTSIKVAEGNTVYHSAGNCIIETASKTLIAGCKNSVIPTDESVTSIGSYAFRGCSSLTSIEIPASVTSIGEWAFSYCNSLTSITFAKNSQLTSIGQDAFYGCSSLESITIPFVGATKDGTSNNHFGYIFGASSYDYNSSYVPKSLKTVVITGGNSIGDRAFFDCSSLTSIKIPASVTSIGSGAFFVCNSLTSIYYKGTKAQWNAISKGSEWNDATGKYTVYCTDGNISKANS